MRFPGLAIKAISINKKLSDVSLKTGWIMFSSLLKFCETQVSTDCCFAKFCEWFIAYPPPKLTLTNSVLFVNMDCYSFVYQTLGSVYREDQQRTILPKKRVTNQMSNFKKCYYGHLKKKINSNRFRI